jgi:hypothetical protein
LSEICRLTSFSLKTSSSAAQRSSELALTTIDSPDQAISAPVPLKS